MVLIFADEASAASAYKALSQDSSVAYVHRSRTYSFDATPNDPLFPYVAGVSKTVNRQWGLRALNLESAWDYVTGTAYVGILDNGILETHSDLQGNYRPHFSASFLGFGVNSLDENDAGSGSHFGYAGHGTHVAGIVAATTTNAAGGAGVCWGCSLIVGRIGFGGTIDETAIANGLNGVISRGAQVVNMSLHANDVPDCATNPNEVMCLAITFAVQRQVSVVAASGNDKTTMVFPASNSNVIAVGGIQVGGALWDQQVSLPDSPARINSSQEIGTNFGTNQTVVAPARDVVSTFYTNLDWNADVRCGSAPTFTSTFISGGSAPGISVGQNPSRQYGVCTGTSMAAPHVSGIVALMRSANPLLTVSSTRSYLTSNASHSSTPDSNWGYGIPNASNSVQAVLATNSRLTPLFALYNPTYNDYLFTTVPQMASAGISNGLLPQPPAGKAPYYTYSWLANYVSTYTSFPGTFGIPKYPLTTDNYKPRAKLRVFTSPKDASGVVLYPIYRFSYVDTTPGSVLTRHFLAFGTADKNAVNPVWKFDGIEGYVYPPFLSQPTGTVKVIRYVLPSSNAYVIFPDGDQGYWAGQGFVSDGSTYLGYAYPN